MFCVAGCRRDFFPGWPLTLFIYLFRCPFFFFFFFGVIYLLLSVLNCSLVSYLFVQSFTNGDICHSLFFTNWPLKSLSVVFLEAVVLSLWLSLSLWPCWPFGISATLLLCRLTGQSVSLPACLCTGLSVSSVSSLLLSVHHLCLHLALSLSIVSPMCFVCSKDGQPNGYF